MLLLWVLMLGVCGDVALSMEGPRGKVTREMCSKPASQVPEEHWPYCCEGYGNHCEDFAASCYLNCQPVVSSGSDVTMVEERPGFCCALYNFCCMREFSRIGNLQKVEAEEQFPTFHRFHVPGKQAPRSPDPTQNIVKQDVNNDISESPSTVNRIGRTRSPSRNNGVQERKVQVESRSSKSLGEGNSEFSSNPRSDQQRSRFNSKPNVVNPQRNSKPQRSQVRFPQRSQNSRSNKIETPTSSELLTSSIGSQDENKKLDNTFGKIASKKSGIKTKSVEKSEINDVHQNTQQLNKEAENRELTLNRSGGNPKENIDNNKVNQETANEGNVELKLAILPKANAESKQIEEKIAQGVSTEQPTIVKQNNRRKVMIGRRVLVRTAPMKISNKEKEISKSIDLEDTNSNVNPTTVRRTIINNKQTSKVIEKNEPENSKTSDNTQSKETKPTSRRRTLIRSRQNQKEASNNEQEISKPADSIQNRQDSQSIGSRRTVSNTRQTGSRRSRPTTSSIQGSSKSTANQKDLNPPKRAGSRSSGRRIKQTVRRVISDDTQKESVQLPKITAKESNEVLPKQRVTISNKSTKQQIASVESTKENKDGLLENSKRDQAKEQTAAKPDSSIPGESPSYLPSAELVTDKTPSYLPTVPTNAAKTPSHIPSNKEIPEAIKLLLESTASQIIADHQNNQNNLKISESEKGKSESETEITSPKENDAKTDDIDQNPLKIESEDRININKQITETIPSSINTPKLTRTRSRTTVPITVTSSRTRATPSTGENNDLSSSRSRSRSRSRSSSRTQKQDPIPQDEAISTSSTNRGSSRSARIESFGRKDVDKSTVQTPLDADTTPRRITRRRGRQPT